MQVEIEIESTIRAYDIPLIHRSIELDTHINTKETGSTAAPPMKIIGQWVIRIPEAKMAIVDQLFTQGKEPPIQEGNRHFFTRKPTSVKHNTRIMKSDAP